MNVCILHEVSLKSLHTLRNALSSQALLSRGGSHRVRLKGPESSRAFAGLHQTARTKRHVGTPQFVWDMYTS